MMNHITKIKGREKFLLGTTSYGEQIYIYKPKFSCRWYWSVGFLGNNNLHLHWNRLKETKSLRDSLLGYLTLEPYIAENLWELAELQQTIYTLKEAAEVFHRGGSNLTLNSGKEYLQSVTLYERLVFDIIPRQCQDLWNLLERNTNDNS